MLLAQCADPANCDIPRSLPWYFSLAMFAVWAAMVAGIVVLVSLLLRARSERRRPRRRLGDSTDIVPTRRFE